MRHIYEIWFPYQRRTALSIKPNRMFLRCYGETIIGDLRYIESVASYSENYQTILILRSYIAT